MKQSYFLFLFLFTFGISKAQTFNGSGGTIPDNGPAIFFPIVVSGLPVTPLDSSFGLESVCLSLTHSNDFHLTIQLVAPDGTTVDLSMNNGGTGNHYTNTCFNGNVTNLITSGSAPFTGTFRAQGGLGNVNNGQQGNGTWQLKIQDHNAGSIGTLASWRITFSNTPSFPLILTSSNLPIVVINTNGQSIVDDPKIFAHMGIVDNGTGVRNHLADPFNSYDGNIGIEIRGSYSQTFPQKQYGFETVDSLNVETDVSILGIPAESDWILYAPWNDKTCMRNVLAYDIANKTGHYASRIRFCELVINGDYKGIYVMLEKVKRDANRVDISNLTLTDTAGTDVTGGYIVKLDKWTGSGGNGWASQYDGYPGAPIEFQYEYPSDVDIQPQQGAYIKTYIDSFENALHAAWFLDPDSGYRNFIDVSSFVDYFILNEASKNVDAYRNSTFLYKKKITHGGKLSVGPAWDYNIAFWNADYCQGDLYSGWQYEFNNICGNTVDNMVPFWWERFLQDPAYTQQLRCRWNQFRLTSLHTDTLMNEIDSMAALLDEAKDRHFARWPLLGIPVWANPLPVATDYPGEITHMKNWLQQRLTWLDGNLPGNCAAATSTGPDAARLAPKVFPNPFRNRFTVRFHMDQPGPVDVMIYDLAGRTVYESSTKSRTGMNELQVLRELTPGLYLLKINTGKDTHNLRIVAY